MLRMAAVSITKVFVYASGLNNRPPCPLRPKMGMNEMAMIKSEKKMAGVTSIAASWSSFSRSFFEMSGGACSSFLWQASIITISASTVAPIAMAMPPRLMIVAGISRRYIGMKDRMTAMGRLMIGRSALRK